jgi:taurine dioxygenase
MPYRTIQVSPVAGAIGAEVEGLDLSRPLSNAQAEDLHQAFLDHKVVFLRGQSLQPAQQVAAAKLFGEPYRIAYVSPMEGYPEIIEIVREPQDTGKYVFGSGWHSDMSFQEIPPRASMLYVMEVPPYGGDTMWVNMEAAYDALSNGMKAMLGGMKVMHSGKRSYGTGGIYSGGANATGNMTVGTDDAGNSEVAHPLVRTHPETGRKALFVNEVYAVRLQNMTEAESRPILDMLVKHALKPEFSCRFRWSAGTVAVWDNRNTMHHAIGDYDGHRRVARRVTIAGEAPI